MPTSFACAMFCMVILHYNCRKDHLLSLHQKASVASKLAYQLHSLGRHSSERLGELPVKLVTETYHWWSGQCTTVLYLVASLAQLPTVCLRSPQCLFPVSVQEHCAVGCDFGVAALAIVVISIINSRLTALHYEQQL